jgi:branched-subunit amino acid transport protein
MNVWLVLLFGGLVTYAIRLSFIVLLERWQMPPIVQRALRFVPRQCCRRSSSRRC